MAVLCTKRSGLQSSHPKTPGASVNGRSMRNAMSLSNSRRAAALHVDRLDEGMGARSSSAKILLSAASETLPMPITLDNRRRLLGCAMLRREQVSASRRGRNLGKKQPANTDDVAGLRVSDWIAIAYSAIGSLWFIQRLDRYSRGV